MRAALMSLVSSLAVAASPAVATVKAPPPAKPPPASPQFKKPKTPFPTDAECQAMGPVMSPLPFGPGEALQYDLDAMGARAGVMSITTLPVREGVLPIEISVETNTFFSKVRKVKATARAEVNPKTLRSQHYFEDAWENEWHRIADVSMKNHVASLSSTINNRTYPTEKLRYGNDMSDVAGAVHLLRSIPVKEGQRLCFDVYGIRRVWRVWGTVQPREHVSLPLGEFETMHLQGEAAPLNLPDARREVHVWVSDDAKRLPLAALGVMEFGAVRATLKGYSRPGEANTRAENKANIKW
ncbi:MAG: DUF3108 domain-containing protein [Archangium sp.]